MNKFRQNIKQPLEMFLTQEHGISREEMRMISKHLRRKNYQKGDYILNQGSIETKLSYLLSGEVHQYNLVGSNEVTNNIAIEGMAFSSFISYANQTPSKQIQRAMSDVSLVYLEKRQIEQLVTTCPNFSYVVFKKLEQVHLRREIRAFILQQNGALRKFEMFMNNEPQAEHYARRIPQKYIASYIGLSQEAYSRAKSQFYGSTRNVG